MEWNDHFSSFVIPVRSTNSLFSHQESRPGQPTRESKSDKCRTCDKRPEACHKFGNAIHGATNTWALSALWQFLIYSPRQWLSFF